MGVKIEEDEYVKVKKKSKYFGVTYYAAFSKWRAQRYSKAEKKMVSNGYYKDEETAALASDNLARTLMENGKQTHKLNFPDEHTEVDSEKREISSKFIGVAYTKKTQTWGVQRWSKNENKQFFNGYYDDEETAAHASDTLARKLMKGGENNLKLNFPDDKAETHPE